MMNVRESDLVEQGTLPPDDFHDAIPRIVEISDHPLEVPGDLSRRLLEAAKHLLVDADTLRAAATALQIGHLVLQGPPGTGKSSLARALGRAFGCSLFPVTAHEDWSTFEVIGRQTLRLAPGRGEEIVPVNGFFTESVIRCAGDIVHHFDDPGKPQATWLLIDEINRAHLDRAFGELFTVLGTDERVPIILPHQSESNRELVTPRRFRIIATLNSVDRQFVNSLGQGLKRRFTFVTVDVPPRRRPEEKWLAPAGPAPSASLALREFQLVLDRAAERCAGRLAFQDEDENISARERLDQMMAEPGAAALLSSLFDLIEQVRYAKQNDSCPFLPIGTAQLIDTVELFLLRAGEAGSGAWPDAMDWAATLKLAPLFDADTVSPSLLEQFANGLATPFHNRMRRELLQIVAAGTYYVE